MCWSVERKCLKGGKRGSVGKYCWECLQGRLRRQREGCWKWSRLLHPPTPPPALSLSPACWQPASRSPSVPLACLGHMLQGGWRGAWPCARKWGLRGGGGDSSVGHPQGTHCPPGEWSTAPQGAAGVPSEDLGSGCGLAVVASKSPHPANSLLRCAPSTAACSWG